MYSCYLRRSKTMLQLILTFISLFFVFTLFAQFGGGQGTEADPWQIGREDHLNNVRNYLGAEHNDKHFILTHNINLGQPPWNEGEGWVPIGDGGDSFHGTFNGDGFVITGMTINGLGNYSGLFGATQDAALKIIGLEDIVIAGAGYRSGGLIGGAFGNTLVSGCYVTGVMSGSGNQNGSLIGRGPDGGLVVDSWTDVQFTTTGSWVGGLLGSGITATVENCYSIGDLIVEAGRQNYGGLIGMNRGPVSNSYSRSNVTAPEGANRVGGFAGRQGSNVINCYSTGRVSDTGENAGGFIGFFEGVEATNNYWDTQTSNMDFSHVGEGRLTRQMTYEYDETTYVNWDFEETWRHDIGGVNNDGYPLLHHQMVLPPLDTPQISIEKVTIDDIINVRLSWDPVEDALSYKIYASTNPDPEDWGEPLDVVAGNITQFTVPVTEADNRFFCVTASPEEGGRRRSYPNSLRSRRSSVRESAIPFPTGECMSNNYTLNEDGDIIN